MFIAGLMGVAVAMLLLLVPVLVGPTVYHRILAINLFGTKTVLLIGPGFFLPVGRTFSVWRSLMR